MLETIREFGQEALSASGEAAATSKRHLRHFIALTESLKHDGTLNAPGAFDRLGLERDNLRTAMRWGLDAGEPELALQLAASLGRFWAIRAAREGLGWITEALASAPGAAAEIRAHGLMWAGTLLLHTGEHDRAAELLEEALVLFREVHDLPWAASTLERLAVAFAALGRQAEARERLEESLAIFRRQDDPRGVSAALRRLAELEWDGEARQASVSLTEEALELSRAGDDSYWTAELLADLAERLLLLDEVTRSARAAQEAVELAHEIGSVPTVIRGLTVLTQVAMRAGETARASLLWATVEAVEQRGDGTLGSEARGRHRKAVISLPESELAASRSVVRALSLDELVTQALRAKR